MSWTVQYEEPTRTVRITFTGRLTREDLRRAASERIQAGKTHGTSAFVLDVRHIRQNLSALTILALPDQIYEAQGADRRSHVAVLLPDTSEPREGARFYENACLNRGWDVRSFTSPDEAYAWLARFG